MTLFRPRNRDGTPIDPIPFLVVVLTAFLLTHAWGPLYLVALGVALVPSLVVVTVLFGAVCVAAYHRLVWTVDPERRAEVPAEERFVRLVYAIPIAVAFGFLLALPFLR